MTAAASDDRDGEETVPSRYAHSYIGVGLTPVVALELEKGGKGSIRELVHFVRTFSRFRPFRIELSTGERVRVDSLLFANISQMAKVAKLSDNGDPARRSFRGCHHPAQPEMASPRDSASSSDARPGQPTHRHGVHVHRHQTHAASDRR